ncbi:hypothetical protein [Kitasatospora sp. NBC_01266]|uniref:hypothetical protein n=1 Tax=Kitasatospora sp. NBC_01266 TaxID=2903572 RepID=UPI002E33FDAF|nr:hypothetical protein [Kitasatospora sp. NBC_01266]
MFEKAQELLESGDVPAAVRELRSVAGEVTSVQAAPVVERLSRAVGFEDLAEAARVLAGLPQRASAPERAQAHYDFGYACVERGLSFLAVPALSEALPLATAEPKRGLFGRSRVEGPEARVVLAELAVALESEERHGEAVELLERHDAFLADWSVRYLLVRNALTAGDVDRAARQFALLPAPDEEQWQSAADQLRRALGRAEAAREVGPLDFQNLRAWHFVLTGGLLGTLSPHGFAAGMTGRYAYLVDGYEQCRAGLERLSLILGATGREPRAVSLLPDRSSRILGLAAARLLGLPAQPYRPGTPDTVVVAYDLTEVDEQLLAQLHQRAPGEVLYEHATCWTAPAPVSADVSTLLAQLVVKPWDERPRFTKDGAADPLPADERAAEELAALICAAEPFADEGDGETPADPNEVLAAFAAAVRDRWLDGPRDPSRFPGPVRSSRFR